MPKKKKTEGLIRGPLSASDKAYIETYHKLMSVERMAAERRKGMEAVRKHVELLLAKHGGEIVTQKQLSLADELETRPEWLNFRQQFSKPELEHFKYRYVQLMGQFRDDILPTEEMQIFQVISLDILIQRSMREQRVAIEEQEAINTQLEELSSGLGEGDERTRAKIKDLEYRYVKRSDDINKCTNRHESYMMRQSAILKELKGTRDQRVKIFENSKHSFLGFLRALSDEEFRLRAGRDIELNALAADYEEKRLMGEHTYVDGTIDHPLLTPELVLSLKEDEES